MRYLSGISARWNINFGVIWSTRRFSGGKKPFRTKGLFCRYYDSRANSRAFEGDYWPNSHNRLDSDVKKGDCEHVWFGALVVEKKYSIVVGGPVCTIAFSSISTKEVWFLDVIRIFTLHLHHVPGSGRCGR